jgi:PST family polysaccharide transporter
MRNLLKSTVSIGVTELALIIVAFVRNKYLAVTIGPYGFGVYGLLSSFFSLVILFTGSWLAYGATKYVAEFKKAGNQSAVAQVTFFSLMLTSVLSIIVTLLFVTNQGSVIVRFLSKEVSPAYFVLYACSILAISICPIVYAILQGLGIIRPVVLVRVSLALLEVGLVISFVYLWNLDGFFISFFLSTAISLLVLLLLLRRFVPDKIFIPHIKSEISRNLLIFGGANLFIGAFYFVGQYFLRVIILQNLDINSVGLLQAGLSIMGYLGIVNRSSSYIFLPQMSEAMDNQERNRRLNDYIRFTLLINIPICFGTILFGNYLIVLLYSRKFLPLLQVLNLFVVAHLLNSIISAFQFSALGKGLMRYYSAISIFGTVLLVLCPVVFVHEIGLTSVPLGYIVSYVGGLLLFYIYSVWEHQYKPSAEVVVLIGISIVATTVSLLTVTSTVGVKLLCGVLLTVLVAKVVRKEEYRVVYAFLRARVFERNQT